MTENVFFAARTGFLAAAAAAAILVRADAWPADPTVNVAIADNPGVQTVPKICPTPDGGCIVSWYDEAARFDVRLQRLDSAGRELWPHDGVIVADLDFDWVQDYGLDVDGAGNSIVVFLDSRGGATQVTANLVSPEGTLRWGSGGTQLTAAASETFLGVPKAVAADDGTYVIAWMEDATTHLQKLDAAGAKAWGSDVVLADAGTDNLHVCDVRACDDGEVIVSLVRENFMVYRHLCAQKIGRNGDLLWGASPVMIFDGGTIQMGNYPPFIVDGEGGAIVCWYEAADYLQCYVQHVSRDGKELFPHNGVVAKISASQQRVSPSAAYNRETGDIFLFWVEEDMGQTRQGVSGQRIGPEGTRMWGDLGVDVRPVGDRECTDVSAFAFGGGALVFFIEHGGPGNDSVLGAVVKDDGSLGSPQIIEVATTPSEKSQLVAAMTSEFVPVLVWDDTRNDGGDIYGQAPAVPGASFRRGDANGDTTINIADAIHVLGQLFAHGSPSPCRDAADANDDGTINIADAIAVLGNLFGKAGPLPDPFESCGVDPTGDGLTCASYPPCP